uniref:Arginine vasopressin-induced protein 1 n=1 Tax=Seriola dumerili TaxID=41447 RepID=A0A3B4TDA8_SERDU
MADTPASTFTEDGLPVQWKVSNRRSRKPGCSNIFSGVNLHQLHRLFRTAGDRDAEHRAKLVWRGMDRQVEAGLKIKVHMKMGQKEH